jgi:hypothetical protein
VELWLQFHICEGHVDRSFFHRRTINTVDMIGMTVMIGLDQLCTRRKPIGAPIGARINPIGSICARDCAWPCTCADRPSQFLCMHMCIHAQNRFADSPKQTACTLFDRRYLIGIDKRRFLRGTFSIAAHRLKFLCILHKCRSHVHNSGTELRVTSHPNLLAPIAHPTRYSAVAKPSKVAKLSLVTFSQYP